MEDTTADSYYVLGQLVEAVNMLSRHPKAYLLLPEIRSNLVMAKSNAKSKEDVAGIPGRLTEVFQKITAPAYPAWGASRFTASILLKIMEYDSSRRSVMEIKYSEKLVELIKEDGIEIEHIDIGTKTLDDVFKKFTNNKLPVVFYTEGGFAREGAIIVTGQNAVEVAKLVLRIADQI